MDQPATPQAALQSTKQPSPWTALLRIVLVVVLGLWTLTTIVPALGSVWRPQGELGMRADYDGRIMEVDPNGAAGHAGVAAHDRIDLARTPKENRRYAAPNAPPPQPGAAIELGILHAGQFKTVTIHARSAMLSTAARWGIVGRIVQALVYVVVGGLLVLLRPSRAAWGFYLSCLGINQPPAQTYGLFSHELAIVVAVSAHVLFAAGTTGFLIFALRFPHDRVSGWRRALEQLAPLIFLITAFLFLYADFAPTLFAVPAEAMQVLALLWGSAVGATVFFALVNTYVHGDPQDRQRIRWVIVGFGVGVGCASFAGILGYSSLVSLPGAVAAANILLFLTIIEPITVAYAVIRYRVLDVRVAISRAFVYAILSSAAIVLFGLIDFVFEKLLAATKLAIVAEIAASIGLGFGLASLQKRVDRIIDSVFFRKRHEADLRLSRLAGALAHASSAAAVDQLLVREPLDSWELASSALFRRADEGTFARRAAIGWPEAGALAFDPDDVLFLQMQNAVEPMRLAPLHWRPDNVPNGPARPALAVPVLVRRTLVAVALYGAPLSGSDFEADEIRLLAALAAGAAAAYDHLEAEDLRQRVAELEASLERFKSGATAPTKTAITGSA